jgi:hypothetical protein
MKKFLSSAALGGLLAFSGAATAQTVTAPFDLDYQSVLEGTTVSDSATPLVFTVAGPGDSLYILGATATAGVTGFASLKDESAPGDPTVFFINNLFSAGPGGIAFQTANLSPGSYLFDYEVTDKTGNGEFTIDSSLITSASAPEIDLGSGATALTLLVGALLVLLSLTRGRAPRRSSSRP